MALPIAFTFRCGNLTATNTNKTDVEKGLEQHRFEKEYAGN